MTGTAPLYVIAPLDITARDRAWIEAIRLEQDPQHGLVEAHVTLVFGVRGAGPDAAAAHVAGVAALTPAIAFRLNKAIAVREAARSLVFLIPGEGADAMRGLHGALYAGPLAAELRTDIPFAPHVTVAALGDHAAAEALAAGIMAAGVGIAGVLRQMILVAFDGGHLQRLGSFPLDARA